MEKKYKITVIIILIAIISVLLRFPNENFVPNGYDTYTHYRLATDIQIKEYIGWSKGLLSIMGYDPISYQTGGILFLSTVATMTGSNINIIIFIIGIHSILLLGIILYLLAMRLFNSKVFALLTVILYLGTRYVISFTSSVFTSRTIFLILYLFVILCLLSKWRYRWLLIGILILFSLTIHKMFILYSFLFVAYVIGRLINKYLKKNKFLKWLLLFAVLAAIFISTIYMDHFQLGPAPIKSFGIDIPILENLLLTGYRLALLVGLPFILIIPGLLYLIWKNKSSTENILITIIVIFIPLLTDTNYIAYLLLPLLIIVSVYGIIILKMVTPSKVILAIPYLVIMAILIPLFITINPVFKISTQSENYFNMPQTIALKEFFSEKHQQSIIICNTPAHIQAHCGQITALTNNKIKSMSEAYNLMYLADLNLTKNRNVWNLKRTAFYKEPILNITYTDDVYRSMITKYNSDSLQVKKIMEFIPLDYVVNTYEHDSTSNLNKMYKLFGETNQVYNNGFHYIISVKQAWR